MALTADNEQKIKEVFSTYPRETKVTILETGEVLQINDIFNYDN